MSALVQIDPVDFDATAVQLQLQESLFASSSLSSSSSSSVHQPRPLKWTHKAPLLAAMAKLDVNCCSAREPVVREVRRRVRKLDKSVSVEEFLEQRELSGEFPGAALDAAATAPVAGDYFTRTAIFAQLLVTTRLVKQLALVAPDHSQFSATLRVLQTLLTQCDSPQLNKFARRIDEHLDALTQLQAAAPLSAAELSAPTSRLSLDWRTLRAADLQQQGAMGGRLVLSEEQRLWAVSLCDRVEKAVDTVNAASTFRRFAPVIRFLQGSKLVGQTPSASQQ
jgi:hypothetical protein